MAAKIVWSVLVGILVPALWFMCWFSFGLAAGVLEAATIAGILMKVSMVGVGWPYLLNDLFTGGLPPCTATGCTLSSGQPLWLFYPLPWTALAYWLLFRKRAPAIA